jgi:hypothetical protein
MALEVHTCFASAPRHVFLFAGLALSRPDARHRLFFIEHVPAETVREQLALLADWPGSPFEHAQRLEADWRPALAAGSAGKRTLKRGFRVRNRAVIEREIAEHPPRALYVPCDNYFESQLALHLATRRDPTVERVYVEDGTAAYEYSYQRQHLEHLPREWLRKLTIGPWWRPCGLVGTSGWLQRGYVAFPELAHPKLRRLELEALPREAFGSPAMLDLARRTATRFGVDVERVANADLLVAVTNSKWARLLPAYRETMVAICESMLSAGKSVALKLHPRERESDPLGLAGRPGVYCVAPQLPFEMLVLLAGAQRLTVVGDASTALLATRWLRPDVRVIALRQAASGPARDYLARTFGALAIPIESEPRRLLEKHFAAGATA